jgi:hypothetical protein
MRFYPRTEAKCVALGGTVGIRNVFVFWPVLGLIITRGVRVDWNIDAVLPLMTGLDGARVDCEIGLA